MCSKVPRTMLDHQEPKSSTKLYFSHSVLPNYVDPHNVSARKKPFSTFNAQPFSHILNVILPEELWSLVKTRLEDGNGMGRVAYAKVYMTLGDILAKDFLEPYLKQGNIMMLSEGRSLVDNVFSLYEGRLRLELDRPTYERCGLQGKAIEDGGKQHQKARWVVEHDLRNASMVHGKKGFSRLEWACKNVLNHSLTWLFYNFNPSSPESLHAGNEPISIYHPKIVSVAPTVTRLTRVLAPEIGRDDLSSLYDQDDSLALLEYLHLLQIQSPRVSATDSVDPYLSRYKVPTFEGVNLQEENLVKVSWRGFLSPQLIKAIYLGIRKENLKQVKDHKDDMDIAMDSEKECSWVAMSAVAFGGKNAWTMMQWEGRHSFVWETQI